MKSLDVYDNTEMLAGKINFPETKLGYQLVIICKYLDSVQYFNVLFCVKKGFRFLGWTTGSDFWFD